MLKADMNKKQKISRFSPFIIAACLALAVVGTLVLTSQAGAATKCGDVNTAIISCDKSQNPIWSILIIVLNVLTGGVGIVAVGGLIYASILYASAGDNSQQVSQAKNLIRDIIIGLVAFGLMYALLQYLVPGGIFTS